MLPSAPGLRLSDSLSLSLFLSLFLSLTFSLSLFLSLIVCLSVCLSVLLSTAVRLSSPAMLLGHQQHAIPLIGRAARRAAHSRVR